MKPFDCKQIILLLCMLFLACAPTKNAGEKIPEYLEKSACGERHLLWLLQKEGRGNIWLLGSIHMADSSFYPLASVIDSALETSDLVAVELDILKDSTVKETQSLVLSEGYLPRGVLLKNVLTDTLYQMLDSISRAWEIPVSVFENFRPWLVANALSAAAFEHAGLEAELGIDVEIISRANDLGKRVFPLETPESQLKIFSAKEDSLGIGYLESTLREICSLDSLVFGLFSAWKCGDAAALRQFLSAEVDDNVYGDEIYAKRNVLMAQKLDSLSSAGQKVFATVGAAHLVGDAPNVLTLLEEKGYQIKAR